MPRGAAARPFHLAGVDTGTHLRPKRLHGVADRQPAANRARRSVEDREEAVTGGVDLLAVEARQLATDHFVVPVEELGPVAVAQSRARSVDPTRSVKSTVASTRSDTGRARP